MNDNVREFCRQECIRQHATTENDFIGMEAAWYYARSQCQAAPLIVEDIQIMASYIDPVANPGGRFRTGPAVFMNGGRAEPSYMISESLVRLIRNADTLTPAEVYNELMYIHPFKDGNGRVGALVYNWLNGTLDNPVNPPEYR